MRKCRNTTQCYNTMTRQHPLSFLWPPNSLTLTPLTARYGALSSSKQAIDQNITENLFDECHGHPYKFTLPSMWGRGRNLLSFPGKCCANMLVRYSIMAAYLMEPEELSKMKLTTLLRFTRASRRFL